MARSHLQILVLLAEVLIHIGKQVKGLHIDQTGDHFPDLMVEEGVGSKGELDELHAWVVDVCTLSLSEHTLELPV